MNKLLQKATRQQVDAVEILTGEEALSLLGEQGFQLQWDTLHSSCPWSTVFQSRAFVSTWYQCYHTAYLPIIAITFNGEKLTGLLTLAQNDSGYLVGAGGNQAEYQVWLTYEQQSERFMKQVMTALFNRFPQSVISIKFAPGNTPLRWIDADPQWKKLCFQRVVRQPLLNLNKENLSQELRKKNRKEKLNRLRRQGNLSFVRVTDAQEFYSILDELAIQSDFRKGAMYNKYSFQEDSYRKQFLKELFEAGLLHVTLLKLDNTIIASNVGVTGKNSVHLQGINTHSPMQAKHSPGILHFLLLGVMLAEEGFAVFDLTPGSDPYKESLATDFTHATELIFGNKTNILNKKVRYKIIEHAKYKLLKLGIEHYQIKQLNHKSALIKEKLKLIKKQNIYQLLRQSFKDLSRSDEVCIFQAQPTQNQSKLVSVNRNALQDLLCYDPIDLTSRWEFMMDAMRKLESGQHVFTWQENERLLAYAWLSESKSPKPPSINKFELAGQAAILHSLFCPLLSQIQTANFIETIAASLTETEGQPVYIIANLADKVVYGALKSLYPSYTASAN